MNAMKIVGCAALAFARHAGAFVPAQAFAGRGSLRPSGSMQVGMVISNSRARQYLSWSVVFCPRLWVTGALFVSRVWRLLNTWRTAVAVHVNDVLVVIMFFQRTESDRSAHPQAMSAVRTPVHVPSDNSPQANHAFEASLARRGDAAGDALMRELLLMIYVVTTSRNSETGIHKTSN